MEESLSGEEKRRELPHSKKALGTLIARTDDVMAEELLFRNRAHAGRLLASKLSAYANRKNALSLALPRGGVPVAHEVAAALGLPLDVFLVRKLGVPGHEELAMGAIAEGGIRILNEEVVNSLNIPESIIERVESQELEELERRRVAYRGNRLPLVLKDKAVIVVDDGLATGATMRAAVLAIRTHQPARIIVAAPVAPLSTYDDFQKIADEVVCVILPQDLDGVGRWYVDFSQISDEEVRVLLGNNGAPTISASLP